MFPSTLSYHALIVSSTEADTEDMDENQVEAMEETNEKILEMKESVTNNVLTMANDVVDEETQDVIIDTLGDMTAGGSKFNDKTKEKIVTTLTYLVKTQVGSVETIMRRRRSTDDETEYNVDGKVYSVEDVSPMI